MADANLNARFGCYKLYSDSGTSQMPEVRGPQNKEQKHAPKNDDSFHFEATH